MLCLSFLRLCCLDTDQLLLQFLYSALQLIDSIMCIYGRVCAAVKWLVGIDCDCNVMGVGKFLRVDGEGS